LARQDVAGQHELAAVLLDAEPAACRIAPVARGAARLFVCHGDVPLLRTVSAADDLFDAHRRLLLTVPALAARVLAATLLEGDDLGRAPLLAALGGALAAKEGGRAFLSLGGPTPHQPLGNPPRRARLAGDLFDREHLIRCHAVLLAASLDDSVH